MNASDPFADPPFHESARRPAGPSSGLPHGLSSGASAEPSSGAVSTGRTADTGTADTGTAAAGKRNASTGGASVPPVLAILLVLLLLLVGISLFQSLSGSRRGGDPNAVPRLVTPRGDLAADEKSTIELFQRMSESVVSIATASVQLGPGFSAVEVPSGTGTGFLWDSLGHVVTNFHVLEGGERWRVTLADQSTWDAEVVGLAEDRDLAVLKINAPQDRLKPVAVGASRDLQVGQRVFAIGCPFGLDQTLTTGIISGLGREIPARNGRLIQGVIQTDAAINPGNSGGPLLDSAGRLIGVNTAIYSPTGTSAGIGFAIPVDMVNRTVPRLLRYGRAVRPVLGVRIAPDAIMNQLGLSGVMIQGVQANGAAAAAGLQGVATDRTTVTRLGDVIVGLNGRQIVRQDDLFEALEQCEFGQQVKLTIVRNATSDEARTLDVELTLPKEPRANRE